MLKNIFREIAIGIARGLSELLLLLRQHPELFLLQLLTIFIFAHVCLALKQGKFITKQITKSTNFCLVAVKALRHLYTAQQITQ